jgi:glycosyltransferase involved in cell wall biosynthesis
VPTICLAMIVRDEAHVIRRCLASVRPLLDHWVVIDTGSVDGTQDAVREALSEVPGELIERPWVDFGHNRNEAVAHASRRADYVLVIDADEVLEVDPSFTASALSADAYRVQSRYGSRLYARIQLLRSALPWRYVGVVHEYPCCEDAGPAPLISGLTTRVFRDGARARDPQTYRRDALLLEAALLEEPDNARNVFYLAQSYRDAGDLELAARHYRARAVLGGWQEEVWYSLYQVASLRELMGQPWGTVLDDYLAAYEFDPGRAEPLYCVGAHYAHAGADRTARVFLSRAMAIPRPGSERLFVEADVYDHALPLAFARVSGRTGDHGEAIACCNRLLRDRGLAAEAIEDALACRRQILAECRPGRHDASTDVRIRVCIPVRGASGALDDCLESIERLAEPPYDVWVVDDGSPAGTFDGLEDRPVRVHLGRHEHALGFEGCIDWFVRQHCDASDIVVPLAATTRCAGPDVLRHVRGAFGDSQCALLYGQHRRSDGTLGDAEPAADDADFVQRGPALASHSPLIFRAGLWTGSVSTWDGLIREAGLDRTVFTDAVLTIHDEAVRPPTRPLPLAPRAGPSVSCLMVTYDRLGLAKRAIRCFAAQTYPNRELVIVTDGERRFRRSLERFVAETEVEQVRFVQAETPGLSLGALRNLSLSAASGDVVCQWDDDDCFHRDRIRVQLEHMRAEGGAACFLTDHFQFLEDDRAMVWVDWTLGGKSGRDQLLPGTIMMQKDARFRYPETGPYARRGEDSVLLASLYDQVHVVALRGEGRLYLYTYHGRNTFDREHHRRLVMFSRSVAELAFEREVIRDAMAQYPVPRPYMVIGRDGPAFMLND